MAVSFHTHQLSSYSSAAYFETVAFKLVSMPLSDFDVARGSVFSDASPVLVVFFNYPLRGRSTLALALVLTPVATFFFFFFFFL